MVIFKPSSELLVCGGRPLPRRLLDGLDGVEGGHAGVQGEEDDGGAAEPDDFDGQAGHGGAHKVAQGEGGEPDSCKMEKEKSRRRRRRRRRQRAAGGGGSLF